MTKPAALFGDPSLRLVREADVVNEDINTLPRDVVVKAWNMAEREGTEVERCFFMHAGRGRPAYWMAKFRD